MILFSLKYVFFVQMLRFIFLLVYKVELCEVASKQKKHFGNDQPIKQFNNFGNFIVSLKKVLVKLKLI